MPVFREADNELQRHLTAYDWEVIFVDDDSDDGTTEVVRSYARTNEHVRLVLRVHERGLSTVYRTDVLASVDLARSPADAAQYGLLAPTIRVPLRPSL